jgi:nitrite reductase/ring-hydroxylating ferredoxin subunit
MPEQLICRSDEVIDGGKGVRFTVPAKVSPGGTAPAEAPAFVIRHNGLVRAYLNRCGHVPVELDWQPGEFFDFSGQYLICATHGALYGPESGRCMGGRCAGKGLTPVPVVEKDGSIYWQSSDEGQ